MPATMEQYLKSPNLFVTVNKAPTFTTSEGFDGAIAWTQGQNAAVNDAPGLDLARYKRSGGLHEPVELKREYTAWRSKALIRSMVAKRMSSSATPRTICQRGF